MGNPHNKMIKSKYAFCGIDSCFFAIPAILWFGCLLPFSLKAQDGSPNKKIRTLQKTTDSLHKTANSFHKVNDSLYKVNDLKEVNIRKQLSKRQLSASPVQILSGEQLERLNSLSVADAIRFFSGVQLKDYGGIGGLKTINVRSMGTNHTAVFYDGVQLGNAQNGQVDLGKFSLDNVEEIELYNGQKSSIFQSAKGFASGSSLYINTKTPEFKDGETNHLKATFKTGSFALINPSLLWQTKISDRVTGTFSTEYKKSDGRYKFNVTNGVYDSTLVRKNADIETMRLEGGLQGKLADSSSWAAKVYFYNDQQGLPGAIVGNVYDFHQRLWNRNFFFQSTYKKEAGRYNLLAAVKYSNDYSRFLNPDFVTVDGFLDNKYKQQELYLSVANRYKINSYWEMSLSGDYQLNTMDANLYHFPYPTRNTFLGDIATQFHFEKLDVQANLLGTYVKDEVKQYFSAGDKHELTPAVLVSWQPFDLKEFRIRGFYKNIFRMPTFNDLYYTTIGSTFLKPERVKQYDLGLTYIKTFKDQLLSEVSIQTDAYYNKVKDKIIAVPGQDLFRWSMRNLGLVQIKGLDVNLQTAWNISRELFLTTAMTYTYQQALDITTVSLNYRNQIPYIPVHSGSFTTGANYRNYGFNYSYIYTGERYNQSANNVYNYVPAWYTHDIAFHYSGRINRGKTDKSAIEQALTDKPVTRKYNTIKASFEINNLLNQYYDVIANFPMPGRNYRITLAYSI